MTTLRDIRAGKPSFYPDPTIHAEYACAHFGLHFTELDNGTGLIFTVGHGDRSVSFGAGRGSFFPQNTATAATLANDKYIASMLMERAGVPTLGGQYFFLHDRHRAQRAPGHERPDAIAYFGKLGGSAFVKPLNGSRGDFAQRIDDAAALAAYLDDVSRIYDAVIMQRVCSGVEYRIFVLDDEIVYCVQKTPPCVTGDGTHTLRELLAAEANELGRRGISFAPLPSADMALDQVLPAGALYLVPGRMNRSAGGSMTFAAPENEYEAFALARQAVEALGLRAGAVDLFADIGGDPSAMRVIEVNANPSIRFLEDSGRSDLILRIWRHTFATLGLLDV
jgi:glutathione synthase/RimK-type ligase-like ATP-grasp enzyme